MKEHFEKAELIIIVVVAVIMIGDSVGLLRESTVGRAVIFFNLLPIILLALNSIGYFFFYNTSQYRRKKWICLWRNAGFTVWFIVYMIVNHKLN